MSEIRIKRIKEMVDLFDDVEKAVKTWLDNNEDELNLVTNIKQIMKPIRSKMADRPNIVCLCGSTRFHKEYVEANYRETLSGNVVLSVGFFPHSAGIAHGEDIGITKEQKEFLDELHKRKIDLSDEIFVINVGKYIGESTKSEIEYALRNEKIIRWLEDPFPQVGSSG